MATSDGTPFQAAPTPGLGILGPIGATKAPAVLPDDVRRRLDLADALTRDGLSYGPVASPWQGAARLADVLVGTNERNQAFADRQNAIESVNQTFGRLLTSGSAQQAPQANGQAPQANGQAPQAGLNDTPLRPQATALLADPGAGGADGSGGALDATRRAMLAEALANDAGSANKAAFVDTYMPMARQAAAATGIDPRLILGQAAQETGWGAHAPGNNLFGLKGPGQVLPTTESVDGRATPTTARFQTFAQPADSFAGYARFINANPRYQPLQQAQGLDAQVAALGQSGYATDPAYAAHVGAIARALPAPAQPGLGGDGSQAAASSSMPSSDPFSGSGAMTAGNSASPTALPGGTLPGGTLPGAGPLPAGPAAAARQGVDPAALLSVMTNPWASPQQQQVAASLYAQQAQRGRYGQYRDGDGSLFQRDLLTNEDKLLQDNHAKSPDIEGYRYARSTGFTGSFADYILGVKKAQAPLLQLNGGAAAVPPQAR